MQTWREPFKGGYSCRSGLICLLLTLLASCLTVVVWYLKHPSSLRLTGFFLSLEGNVPAEQGLCWCDVEIDEASEAVRLKRAMEASWRELNPS